MCSLIARWSVTCLLSVAVAAHSGTDSTVEPVVSTYAGNGATGFGGDGGDRREASLVFPVALAWDREGNLLYLDMGRDLGGRIRRVDTATGIIDTLAGGGSEAPDGVPAREAALPAVSWGLAVDSAGNIFVGSEGAGVVSRIDARSGVITRFAGGGELLTSAIEPRLARLWKPMSVRVDDADNVYIVDGGLNAVFKVDAVTGLMDLVAGTPGQSGFAGDGQPATEALLNWPTDLALDHEDNLYIADRNNHVIRRVQASSGTISTFAGIAASPGFAGDGGDRLHAQFRFPHNLLLEDGSLLIADMLNHRVRNIDLATGAVATVAGSGNAGYMGENVAALQAGLFEPAFLLRHPGGGLLVAAERSRRIFLIGEAVEVPVPWWRRPWAIAAYGAVLALLTIGLVRLRTRGLRLRMVELELSVFTRSRELEEQKALVERQAGELSELITAKDQLMARISHEFRTPLTVILGPIDRLMERATDQSILTYLEVTRRNASRLLRLVDQLLNLTRLRSGHCAPTVSVSPGPVLRQVIASFESLAVDRGVSIELGTIENCSLQSTNEAVEMIAVNLVSNALKFTPSGGVVRVSLNVMAGMGQLAVVDSGNGIIESRLATIFEPFEPSATDRTAGSGLGLALVRQMATAHGGSVEVRSEPGMGSAFRVRLPLARVGAAEPSSELSSTSGSDARLEAVALRLPRELTAAATEEDTYETTVLVIEDNADMRDYLQQLLSPQYRCLLAEDGVQGFETAAVALPDLVVSDVMLPGQDGYAVCHALKSDDRTCHIPVILLTALQGRTHKLKGLHERADDYLTKPFNESELLQRIANLLEVRALLRRRYARELRIDKKAPAELGQGDGKFLKKLAEVCHCQHADPDFDVVSLAAALSVSERQLQRKLKVLLGLTPAEYLREYRLQRAHARLLDGGRASDVAISVGFGSHAYFSNCFKARFGCTPGGVLAHKSTGA